MAVDQDLRIAGSHSSHADLVAAHTQARLAFEHAQQRIVAEAVQVVAPDDDTPNGIVAALICSARSLDFNALNVGFLLVLLGVGGAVYCNYWQT
ncbi:hypothetical protein D3C71_497120 [compost metagenome]